ncbi:hypothetical protein AB0H45_10225 [Streptomyces atroolivaceus]|uniref:PE-PGRS family protein n=1 Tax=Streptomyces atroolivaceus TaxID=66869 RepID=A0ABV9V9J0_STRAZ|nr:hypothetical protein [Streptomyces atroolivaceus]
MSMGWQLRALRSALFAAVCVALASSGHVLMSGRPVPWWALAVCAGGVGALGWLVAGRERGPAGVVGLTLAVQAALHGVFVLIQTEQQPARAGSPVLALRWADALLCGPHQDPAAAARAYDIAEQAGLIDSMRLPPLEGGSSAILALGHASHGVQAGQHLHDMDTMTGAMSWGMLAAHAIAALLCGLWLACGERAAFQILRAVADRFHIPLSLLSALRPLPTPPPAPPVDRPGSRPRLLPLVHTLVTRGPPRETAVC